MVCNYLYLGHSYNYLNLSSNIYDLVSQMLHIFCIFLLLLYWQPTIKRTNKFPIFRSILYNSFPLTSQTLTICCNSSSLLIQKNHLILYYEVISILYSFDYNFLKTPPTIPRIVQVGTKIGCIN